MDTMITTWDNPFNPFEDYDGWFQWDSVHGYNTPGLLARVTITSEALSEADQDQAIEQGIDEIVENNVTGLYRKVKRGE